MRKSFLPQLNAGNHTPRLVSKSFTRSKEKSVKRKENRVVRRPHYLPPLLYNDRLLQRPLTITRTADLSAINRKGIFSMDVDSESVSDCTFDMFGEERGGQQHKMFNRMSKEAQEAYNQTLQEMSSEDEGQRLEEKTNKLSATMSSISSTSMREAGSNSSSNSGLQKVRHTHMDDKLDQVPRVIQSEPTSVARRKRNTQRHLKKKTSMPLLRINSKAPISHTAARIGRKKRSTKTDTLSSHSDFSNDNSGHIRPFEITPLGYDSRYTQNVPCVVQYNTDDDEDLATYVIEQATAKCSHWLSYQNGTS